MRKIGTMKRIGAVLLATAAVSLAYGQEKKEAPASSGETIKAIRTLFAQGRWTEAVQALGREEIRQPGQDDLLFLRAMVTMETGDYAGAAGLYLKLMERYPENAGLKNNMAWLRVKSTDPAIRNLDRALQEVQEAIMASPQDYNIWNTLGEVRLARGDLMGAMRAAVLARDMASLAGERDLGIYQDLVRRCEAAPEKAK